MSLDKTKILEFLNKIPFFENFTGPERNVIAGLDTAVMNFQPGDYIVREGDFELAMVILLKGSAIVTKNRKPRSVLAKLKVGDLFGEIAYLNQSARIANVIASGEAYVLKMDAEMIEKFDMLLQKKISDNLMRVLGKKLESMNETLGKYMP